MNFFSGKFGNLGMLGWCFYWAVGSALSEPKLKPKQFPNKVKQWIISEYCDVRAQVSRVLIGSLTVAPSSGD